MVGQWLSRHASKARAMGLIPGWGTNIPHAVQCGRINKYILEDAFESDHKDEVAMGKDIR